jgi:hypothetical protein
MLVLLQELVIELDCVSAATAAARRNWSRAAAGRLRPWIQRAARWPRAAGGSFQQARGVGASSWRHESNELEAREQQA